MGATRILLINGPNLNLLGKREPGIYGSSTLPSIVSSAKTQADSLSATVDDFQSNHESAIVDRIHQSLLESQGIDFIIINPGALTHTSVALRDALLGVNIPFLEVHLSNVHARAAAGDTFRGHSYLSDKAVGVICGLGEYGYTAGVEFAVRFVEKQKNLKEGSKL